MENKDHEENFRKLPRLAKLYVALFILAYDLFSALLGRYKINIALTIYTLPEEEKKPDLKIVEEDK